MNGVGLHTLIVAVPPAALLILIGLWLYAVFRLHGFPRRCLLWVGIGVFLLAALLFGGQRLLLQYELAWRFWVKLLLAVVLWCAGLAVGVLTAWFIPRAVKPEKSGVGSGLCVAAAVCLMIVMGFGTIWGGLWISPATEEVTDYRGEKVIAETNSWMDYTTTIYEYHGPFIRGDNPIGPIGG